MEDIDLPPSLKLQYGVVLHPNRSPSYYKETNEEIINKIMAVVRGNKHGVRNN